MDTPDNNSSSSSINKLFELVNFVKSWIPGIRWSQAQPSNEGNASQSQSGNVSRSRDFWMPDHSCRVCYECDSQFTIFNRRHHCRLCGRVFCAKCTTNSVPAPSDCPRHSAQEDWERIRVCNYCFKQWSAQGTTVARVDNDNGTQSHAPPSPAISRSASATSVASSKSSCTYQSSCSTVGSTPYPAGPYQRVPYTSSAHSPPQSARMDSVMVEQHSLTSERSTGASFASAIVPPSPKQFGYCFDRSDDEDDDYGVCPLDSETRHISRDSDYYDAVNIDEIDNVYGPHNAHPNRDSNDLKNLSSLLLPENFDTKGEDGINKLREEVHEHDNCDGCEASAYDMESLDAEPVDFENNGLLWLPPEPEDKEDEREPVLLDDDGDDHSPAGEWGYLHSSNGFGSGESRSRDKSCEEHRKAMKNVVEGHFRALVSQLLQVENLPVGDEHDKESWLEIITSLSWEAATLLKPDTSKGEGMDPGGYVKVKCIASGCHSESVVVKGIVCKKNVAHRRMKTNIEKPRLLILGGALEYQRVTNHLSSFDTLLQQEMDHLKMAVAKIDAHHPNILLVEKSVSRYAQEYLLAKDISLVLNIKRPLLERIARCTGAKIVPSIDHFATPKLGYCGSFHVEKFLEVDGSAGRGGKKLTKTLMFFEGCPKPFGCTILLKGANEDELKKVKHVVQYGVFAAYHLALETSFLADEGASLPELPLKSPITVALPDKLSSIERSISTIPGFTVPPTVKPLDPKAFIKLQKSYSGGAPSTNSDPICKLEGASPTGLSKVLFSHSIDAETAVCSVESSSSLTSLSSSEQGSSASFYSELSLNYASEEKNRTGPKESFQGQTVDTRKAIIGDNLVSDSIGASGALQQGVATSHTHGNALAVNNIGSQDLGSLKGDTNNQNEGMGASKEEFPPSPSDHQSILVSLSSRCVWKGTVCERAHLLRIKYYGSFDKPLGRFLRDHLFDQSYRCRSCDMPSEAHVYCYTHQQGSLTISVKKLPEFLLPGEREGKIWMWHRCLKCPRTNGFPPATERVVMSDAAWGLSFGKFLELSFSNHAAASRVASCGHSLHRDCLRFYGFGRMVACFRYASIDVHSVYLPPQKLEFFYDNQEWIKAEVNELCKMAEGLFTEVYKALRKISENISRADSQDPGVKAPDSRHHIAELEGLLHKEKQEFEEAVQKVICKKVKFGQLTYDILEINKLRRQMLFHSYVWDQRLIHEARLSNNNLHEGLSSSIPKLVEKSVSSVEKLVAMNAAMKAGKGYSSCDSLLETKPYVNLNQGGNAGHIKNPSDVHKGSDMDLDINHRKGVELSSSKNISDDSDPLKSGGNFRRAHSEGEYPILENLSDTLDAAWTGESHPAKSLVESFAVDQAGVEVASTLSSMLPRKPADNMEGSTSWVGMHFLNFYGSFSKNISLNAQKLGIGEYNPVYVSSFRELVRQNGARLLLPAGVNDIVVHVYDDEPTSVVAYALVSSDYLCQISEPDRAKNVLDTSASLPLFDSVNLLSLNSFDEAILDSYRSLASIDESNLSGSRSSQAVDPLLYTKDLHVRVSFTDDGPLGKVKYTVTCYYAKRFEALRRICCPSELDFVRSISRCKKWGAQGGKSNVFFAKTLDDRFIIKQVTKTELESFIKFAPAYFKYLSESISTRSPTCLAKILGIYQISLKHLKGGKESKLDVLVMENLLYRRNVTRLYDLKGSSRSRYNPDTSGSNKVLLDQNLIEAMPTSPIFVGNKAKRLLERAVWNDTSFLASIDVMDYSLLVGVDEEKHELVLGIIDFMRQYTWDKHLETWVKTSGILGGSKNTSPTVISPQEYKKRFRKAMTAYFVMVPDQWSSSILVPSGSQSDLCDENLQGGNFD
ncbi:1-phosphatidylinositol-3-phosphate 5-kinase FAB1B isoform X2 [Castanea sativa]|uniref:1-phosphatidylinositol-3-phosphate 5-kinase FAB1B isoform X2 n=1 Tax=Castanea sativa TaxID=21020 RepID=UPI003F64DDB6